MAATEQQITELASAIGGQAHAIAQGTLLGTRYAAAQLLRNNVDTLVAWVRDDRP